MGRFVCSPMNMGESVEDLKVIKPKLMSLIMAWIWSDIVR